MPKQALPGVVGSGSFHKPAAARSPVATEAAASPASETTEPDASSAGVGASGVAPCPELELHEMKSILSAAGCKVYINTKATATHTNWNTT